MYEGMIRDLKNLSGLCSPVTPSGHLLLQMALMIACRLTGHLWEGGPPVYTVAVMSLEMGRTRMAGMH